jgi:uncharacterized protein YndB with AHSA1/START domain
VRLTRAAPAPIMAEHSQVGRGELWGMTVGSNREAEAERHDEPGAQPKPCTIRWKLFFRSPPSEVYRALATSEGRCRFWAETAEERDGTIVFVVPGGHRSEGRILERSPDRRFATEYFGWTVRFDIEPAADRGTDLTMTCTNVPEHAQAEVTAGWVSVLLAMKAAVDHGIDLRNHDPGRTWWEGYADN